MFALLCFLLPLFAAQASPANPQPANVTTPQSAASAPAEPMPTDPAALLALAAKKNGLQNAGTAPLHVKATYQLLDDSGAVTETGTFEEFRVSAKRYKLIYSSPSLSQTDYSTDAGLFRVGNLKWPDVAIMEVHDGLYPDFPSKESLAKSRLGLIEKTLGPAKLKCITLESVKAARSAAYSTLYCLSSGAPILRLAENFHGVEQTLYNGIVPAQGAYVAKDIAFSQLGKVKARVHLDSVTAIPTMDESVFIPPSAAVKVTRRQSVPSGVMLGNVVRKVAPEYPAIAKAARIQGTVVLQAVIGKDGKVTDLHPISGPPMLMQAAIDAVGHWEYQPYSLDGEPIEVRTEVNVVFSIGG
jgi:TonB family protein